MTSAEQSHESGLPTSLLRAALEASPGGVLIVDPGGQILFANSETARIFGYGPEELIGQPIEVLVPERFRAQHPANVAAFLSSPSKRAMGAGRDLVGRRKDSSEFPVEVGLNPTETHLGVGVIASVSDITRRKQIEGEARRARDTTRALVAFHGSK